MCLSPIVVPNKWYCPHPPGSNGRELFEMRYPSWFLHDTTSPNLTVPCGRCAECYQIRQSYYVQRCITMSRYNYILYGTLTYRDEALPHIRVNGYDIKFSYVSDFQNFIKRLRKYVDLPPFRYLAVSERGGEPNEKKPNSSGLHRPHFHFLLFIEKHPDDPAFIAADYAQRVLDFIPTPRGWSRNLASPSNSSGNGGDTSSPIYYPLSRFIRLPNKYTYDCHVVTGSPSEVSYYVTKYVLKFNDYEQRLQQALRLNLPDDEYYRVWSVVRSKIFTSNGLGVRTNPDTMHDFDRDIINDLRHDIDFSKHVGLYQPSFYDGHRSFNMAPYFKNKLVTLEDSCRFHDNEFPFGPFEDSSRTRDLKQSSHYDELQHTKDKIQKFNNMRKRITEETS